MSFAQPCSMLKQSLVCICVCKTSLQLNFIMFTVISAFLPFSFGKEHCQYTALGLISSFISFWSGDGLTDLSLL